MLARNTYAGKLSLRPLAVPHATAATLLRTVSQMNPESVAERQPRIPAARLPLTAAEISSTNVAADDAANPASQREGTKDARSSPRIRKPRVRLMRAPTAARAAAETLSTGMRTPSRSCPAWIQEGRTAALARSAVQLAPGPKPPVGVPSTSAAARSASF
jgi:hypothetical protein